jgi:hypothetical protein
VPTFRNILSVPSLKARRYEHGESLKSRISYLINLGYSFVNFSNTQLSKEFRVRVAGNAIICVNGNDYFKI